MSGLKEFERELRAAVGGFVELSGGQVGQMWAHYELMVKWNKVMNLTRVVEMGEAVVKHYGESLWLGSVVGKAGSVLDVGSGAGFPGVVLGVLWPEVKVTLVEADIRKAAFLRECRDFVGNVEVRAERAEVIEGAWELVVSRAVTPKEVLRVGRRVGERMGLLVSEGDGGRLKWGGARVVGAPWEGSGVVWMADVPRGT